MDEFKDKKKKLISIKNEILRMPNNILKASKVEGYNQLLGYLKEIGAVDNNIYDIDDDFINKYGRHVNEATKKKINEIIKVSPKLYSIYSDIICKYKEENFCSFEFSIYNRVKPDEMYEYLFEFINVLGEDVCRLYNKMIRGNNIYLSPGFDYLGVSLNAITIDNPCIIIDSIESCFDFYVTLLHELGHCYQFYLQRNHTHFESFNPYMETTSLLFEKLFCEFLKSKNKYHDILNNYELEDHIYFLNDISISRLLCVLLMQGSIKQIDPFSLNYESSFSQEELLLEVMNDCGYIMENKLDMSLTEFHYSIGNIIATYFVPKMKKDFHSTWKEYKDFICMVDNYPLEEVLDNYVDMDLMGNSIKKLMKNYHNR